jgi:uncharacterized protein YlxW (UPF0749 family)
MTDRRADGAIQENNVTWERHAQTVGISLTVLALAALGTTMKDMYNSQIEQRKSLEVIQTSMSDLKDEVRDIRNRMAAVPTNREIDAKFDTVYRRLDNLEDERQ